MSKQFLTCIFKLHNPSAHKRAVMDHALREYTKAYGALLDWARDKEAALAESGQYINKRGEAKLTGKSLAAKLPRPKAAMHSSAVHSLRQDVAGNLASYFELQKAGLKPSFPTAIDLDAEADADALENFIAVGSDEDDENQSRARLLRQLRGGLMPLEFGGADGASQNSRGSARNRYFSLVSDERERLFAVMYLLPARHELCKPLNAQQGNLYRLDTGEVFTSNSSTAILMPLQVGRNGWQLNKFLLPSRDSENVSIKTGALIKHPRTSEYFLHVAFEFECPKPFVPEAYVGIDKGILFTAAYAIVDTSGKLLDLGHFNDELRALQIKHGRERERLQRKGKRVTERHYKRRAYEQILHSLANDLIDMALKHRAGIVVEDLNIQVRGRRGVSRFRKFDRILEYKCALVSVPFRRVFAAYSSVICHVCGENLERDNREINCPYCGYEGHSDDNAAVNIARRAMYRKADWSGGYREFHRSFAAASQT